MEDNLEEYKVLKLHLWLQNMVPCYWKTGIPKTPQLEEKKHIWDFIMGRISESRQEKTKNWKNNRNVIKIMVSENSHPKPCWDQKSLISRFRSGSWYQHWAFCTKSLKVKFKLLSSVPCLYPGEVNKLAIRHCFCLPAHPINDNLRGMNNVEADASGMLREFQLIPQIATLLWQVPLQKDPTSISAK